MKDHEENRTIAWTGILLIAIMFTCFLAAFFTLGAAINWPESLDYEPEKIFPLILQKSSAVYTGYYLYLIYSLLLIPVVYISGTVLTTGGRESARMIMKIAIGFAIASAVFRALGIIRWPFAMMHLAEVYVDPNSGEILRAQTEVIYHTLNLYAGKVGEHLGVGLAGSFMMLFFGTALLISDLNRTVLGWATIVLAFCILPLEDYFPGFPGFYITVSTTLFLIWLLVLASSMFQNQSRG